MLDKGVIDNRLKIYRFIRAATIHRIRAFRYSAVSS